MKQTNRPCGHALRFLAFLLSFLPGLNPAFAQTWPANPPTISSDFSLTAGATAIPDWVNCDMYSYVEGPDTYYLLAVAYDNITSISSTVHVIVWDSKTGSTATMDIPDAKHPDIVIGDFNICGTPAPSASNTIGLVYEDLNANRVVGGGYPISGVGTTSLAFTPYGGGVICGYFVGITGSKNPHIDLFSGGSTLPGPLAATYEVNTGSGDEIRAVLHNLNQVVAVSVPGSNYVDIYVDHGIRPDVATIVDIPNGLTKVYFVYYKDDFSEIKRAELDPDYTTPVWTYPVTTFPSMETNLFYGYPRIEATNIKGSSNTPWHALAETHGENGLGARIHGYNYTGTINVIDYGMTDDEYSPTVAVANGSATYGNPSDVGNDGYTVGWNVNGNELNALYLNENNSNTISLGYDQVNTTALGITGYGTGYNRFAMTSSTNSGLSLAAAWWDGSEIIAKIVGNSFAFKPTTIKLTNRNKINIHPNPATNQLYVSGVKTANYTVTNITGQQLLQGEINSDTALDISDLAGGVYFLNVSGKDVSEHVKFVKE